MNADAAVQTFALEAELASGLFGLTQVVRSQVYWWLALVLRLLLFPFVLALAQVVPFLFKNHFDKILPHLPSVTDRAVLAWLKDTFMLYHFAMEAYRPYCLFRARARAVLAELDEEIDSLEFVLDHDDFLHETVTQIERG